MKKLILSLIFLFPIFLNAQDIIIDERITDIYHVNGMLVTENDAKNALFKIIKQAAKKEIYHNNETAMDKETDYKLLYNDTYGEFWDTLESFKQGKADDRWFWVMVDIAYSGGCGLLTGGRLEAIKSMFEGLIVELVVDPIQNWFEITFLKNLVELFFTSDICSVIPSAIGLASDIMHDKDFTRQIADVRESVRSGHRVVVIAHAQGNFFFNEIYKAIESHNSWMTHYIKAIAIASPSKNLLGESTAVAFDNDPVAEISDGVVENPMRYVRIIVKPEDESRYEGQTLPCANGVYFRDDYLLDSCLRQHDFGADYDVKNLKFNAFEYYMMPVFKVDNGIEVIEKANPAYSTIITVLKDYIQSPYFALSQWKIKKNGSCNVLNLCKYKLKYAKHMYDDSLNQYVQSLVYPFDADDYTYGKLYPLKNGEYVRAKSAYGDSVDPTIGKNICYLLKDENNETLESIDDSIDLITEPTSGFVEVSVSWENTDADMDLNVVFPAGVHDVKDECQLMEHFYSPSESAAIGAGLKPGLYPVYITYSASDINASQKEMQDVRVRITVPGHDEIRVVSLKVLDGLSRGHIADIKVEDRKIEVILGDSFRTHSKSVYYHSSGYTGGGYSGGYVPITNSTGGWTATYVPSPAKGYIYSIIWHISQALLGPLAGANISIYELKDYNLTADKGSNPLYSEISSYGSSIYTAGVIAMPREIIDALSDEKLYIVEAKGGVDIDANDDKVVDINNPVINLGSVRAVTSGSALKNIGFKLNILTEMAYQISKQYYDKDDLSKFISKSDETVKCLLKTDINLDNVTNTIDALYFTPYNDMDKLYRSYRNEFMPIINKIHKGEDIYEDSFKLYAKPLVKGGYFSVNEDALIGTVIGRIDTDCVSESPVHMFTLSGVGAENFEVDNQGNLKVSQNANLVYEQKRIYSLQVTDTNAYGNSPAESVYITVTADNSPVITNSIEGYIFENMPNGYHVGTISVNNMGYPVTSMRLEGYGAEYFNIDNSGKITVAQGENITLSDKVYNLMVIAANTFGESAPSFVRFNIYDDVPVVLNDISVTIREDIAKGTILGKPSYYEGFSAIKEFKLEGYGAENFNVSIDGTIRVSENANIKTEDSPYRLSISAENEQGVSEIRTVNINIVSSEADSSISLYDFNANIYVSAENNSVVGKIAYSYGYTVPDSFTLSGTGSERFSINSNGVIILIDNRGLSVGQVFNLEANASGSKAKVKITVIGDVPSLRNFSVSIMEGLEGGTAIGKPSYSYGASPITAFELIGGDAEYFTIDADGTIRIKEGVNINYDIKNIYTFTIKATNSIGNTAQSTASVTLIDDAPVLKDTVLNIMENSYGGEIAGYVKVGSNGKSQITSFTLSGESEYFTVDSTGLIKVATRAKIDYESKSVYNLQVIASNSHDVSKSVNITINVVNAPDEEPILIPTTLSVDENSPANTIVGSVAVYSHGNSPITSFTILNGTNSDWFAIDSNGQITVTNSANLDYESKKVFNLKVKADNIYGESNIVDVTININNLPDIPPTITGVSYYFSINENSPANTFIGQLSISSYDSPVTSVMLDGEGAENFKAYNNGTVVVNEGANLDYESKKVFDLKVKADNIAGSSNTVTVRIYLNNLPDFPPAITGVSYYFYINENSPAETFVGQLDIDNGSSPVTSVMLDGEGNENFKVYNNGTVVVNEGANLDYESKNFYYLSVQASNVFGDSNIADIDIYLNNLKDTLPVLQDSYFSMYKTILADKTIGAIRVGSTIHCDITGYVIDDNSVFNIRDNGEIYTNTVVSANNDYTMNVYALSTCGNSNTIKLTIDTKSRIIGQFDTLPHYAYGIALSSDDTKAFVTGGYGGLKIIDVINPLSPSLAGQFNTYAYDVTLSSDETKAFVTDSYSGRLKIIDIYDPAEPALIGQINTRDAQYVTLSSDDTKAFVTDQGSFKIIDISNPVNPVPIGQFNVSSYAEAVTLSSDETKAFVADYTGGLKIIDISNPAEPALINQFDTSYALDIVLSSDDTKAFVADGYSLKIIDVSNPAEPAPIGQIGMMSYARAVVLSSDDTKAFVADYYDGLKIIDVSNPANPVLISQIPLSNAYDIALSSDNTKAFVADGSGLKIIDIENFINNQLPPVMHDDWLFYIDENSPAETFVGQLQIDDNGSPVTSVTLSGEGSENFKVYSNGTIVVKEGANLNYEDKRVYSRIYVKATNAFGDSITVNIRIYVNDLPDNPPVIPSYIYFHIDENSPAETFVGQLDINNGSSPVISITLDGEGNENFKAYNNGTIVVNDGANLDYESKNSYALSVKAVNEFGGSNVETAYIYVGDMGDTSPALQNTYINVLYETIYMDEEIGGIRIVSDTYCEITEFVLDDNSVFDITEDGLIYVKTTTVSEGSKYTTNIYAVSTCGNSNTIKLTLDTKNRIIGQTDILSYAWTVTLSSDDTKAFVTDDEGLKIIDVSDSANPTLIDKLDTPLYIYDIVLSSDDTKVFVTDDDGLKIIDVSNPANPTLLGWFDTLPYVEAVAISSDNTKAFITDNDGLKIIDVSNPANPTLIGQFDTSSYIYDIVLSSDESKVFTVDDYYGLKIIDVRNPANPTLIGQLPMSGYGIALSSDETKAFIADGDGGLKIIDIEGF
ncbi:MAG: cadherin domain-containing protein [Campylobacteraceae bacterium]|jgi:hypothetical protein|nr:cadherin domain-containing protein [Campylobacteraceae bacterium]